MQEPKDQLYKSRLSVTEKFRFDDKVAAVFQDMISRSVPGYQQILEMVPTLVKYQRSLPGNYYDLGCSLGAGMLAMADGLKPDLHANRRAIIGVDNSPAMLQRAEKNLALYQTEPNVSFDLACSDLQNYKLQDAALTLMNFTLQFIPLEQRDNILKSIFDNCVAGGTLVLSEKIKFTDADTNTALIDIHHQYKADQGYSQLEIAQKRDAIENVLVPETMETHMARLEKAGFSIIVPWIQNLQFVSILAIKK